MREAGAHACGLLRASQITKTSRIGAPRAKLPCPAPPCAARKQQKGPHRRWPPPPFPRPRPGCSRPKSTFVVNVPPTFRRDEGTSVARRFLTAAPVTRHTRTDGKRRQRPSFTRAGADTPPAASPAARKHPAPRNPERRGTAGHSHAGHRCPSAFTTIGRVKNWGGGGNARTNRHVAARRPGPVARLVRRCVGRVLRKSGAGRRYRNKFRSRRRRGWGGRVGEADGSAPAPTRERAGAGRGGRWRRALPTPGKPAR